MLGGDIDANGTITVSDLNIYRKDASKLNQYLNSDITMDEIVSVSDFNVFQGNQGIIGYSTVKY